MNDVDLVVTAARLLDGHRELPPLQADAGIAIDNGKIVAVGRASEVRSDYSGRVRLDFPEGTLLPGFIDAHCHLTQPGDGSPYEHGATSSVEQRHGWAESNARRHLAAGVTTLRDLGSHADLFSWRNDVTGPLPRMLLYGRPLTSRGGHMHHFGGECSGPAEVRERAQENLEMGSDGLKVVASGGTTLGTAPHLPSFSVVEMAAATEVAHAKGKIVTAHALPVEAMRRALDADIDGIEHLGFLKGPNISVFDSDLAQQLVDRGVGFGSTLGVNRAYIGLAEQGSVPDYELDGQRERSRYYVENARRLHQLGARLVAATDAGWKFTPFGHYADELVLLGDAGLATTDVVHAATAGSAEYLKLPDVGRLAVDFEADVIVVDGDPRLDLEALGRISCVVARGQVV